jgi:protein involved in sex pheromone biosynthesis
MKNKKTLIIILVALVLFLAGAFVRLQNQKQLVAEREEKENLEQEAQQIEATDSVAEAEALLDQIEIEGLDDDFEVIDKDLDQL